MDEEIAYLKWNINKTKLEIVRWEGGDLSNVFLEKESKGAKTEKILESMESSLKFKEDMKESLIILIETFKGMENELLKKKYVEGKALDVIAEELSYSHGHIRQKHAELRRRLDFLDDYEEVQRKNRKLLNDTSM